jgi:hypothetical protein
MGIYKRGIPFQRIYQEADGSASDKGTHVGIFVEHLQRSPLNFGRKGLSLCDQGLKQALIEDAGLAFGNSLRDIRDGNIRKEQVIFMNQFIPVGQASRKTAHVHVTFVLIRANGGRNREDIIYQKEGLRRLPKIALHRERYYRDAKARVAEQIKAWRFYYDLMVKLRESAKKGDTFALALRKKVNEINNNCKLVK